jgi:hypothetical protein
MKADRELVTEHLAQLLTAASERGIPPELIGRLLLDEVVALWRRSRSLEDIAAELDFVKSNLDPDQDYVFMRP